MFEGLFNLMGFGGCVGIFGRGLSGIFRGIVGFFSDFILVVDILFLRVLFFVWVLFFVFFLFCKYRIFF